MAAGEAAADDATHLDGAIGGAGQRNADSGTGAEGSPIGLAGEAGAGPGAAAAAAANPEDVMA